MRPIHEIAVVMDNGKYTGFLVGYEEDIVDKDKYWYSRLRYVDAESMRELVKADTVQCLGWDEGQQEICVKYTEEEYADVMRTTDGRGKVLIEKTKTFADWLRNDIAFDACYTRLAEGAKAISASFVNRVKVPFLGSTYSLILYGTGAEIKVNGFVESLDRSQKGLIVIPYMSNNNATVVIHEKLYARFASELSVMTYVSTEERDTPGGLIGMLYTSAEARKQVKEVIDPVNQMVYRTFFH